VYHGPSFVILIPPISFFLLLHRALPWYGVEAAEPLDKDRVGDKGAAGGSRRSRSLVHHHFFYPLSCQCFLVRIRLCKNFEDPRQSRKIQKTTIFCTLETKKLEALYARLESGVFETEIKKLFALVFVSWKALRNHDPETFRTKFFSPNPH
jgi:hypothetical protein